MDYPELTERYLKEKNASDVQGWLARLDRVLDAFFAHHIKLFAKRE